MQPQVDGTRPISLSLPGYPSFMTLLAFYIFTLEKVDVAILETGMGGETDSTNVVNAPIATGITELGFDHVKALGNTIESIAWHKAGIFKLRTPAFSVPQANAAAAVLEQRACEKSTRVQFVTDDFLTANDIHVEPDEPFQRSNAALAIALAGAYMEQAKPCGQIDPIVAKSVERTELPAKFEIVQRGIVSWVLTSAHNEMSIKTASQSFLKYVGQ